MAVQAETELKPFLKWAGGKRWFAPFFKEHFWRDNACLYEPFCGGLGLTLTIKPKYAFLNDSNKYLISLYRHVQRGLGKMPEYLAINDEETYYRNRKSFNVCIKYNERTPLAAWLFYYLNRTGFNGLCRFNQEGQFNVPYGKYKKVNYDIDFQAYRPVFEDWNFDSGDFKSMGNLGTDRGIWFIDPPYDDGFASYQPSKFGWADQVRLADWAAHRRGLIVAMNKPTDRIINLYSKYGFRLWLIEAPRRISCNGDRTPVKELLITNSLQDLPLEAV